MPAASHPFTEPAYLDALEASGCVTPATGWTPVTLPGTKQRLPLYAKAHSWGEFVFDFELARVWQSQGLAYYPKLVACVPFTPVPGSRLMADDDAQRRERARALREQARDYSGAHVLFADAMDRDVLRDDGWIARAQSRYVWQRRDAADFDDFLARLDQKRRKNIRAERKRVQNFDIRWQPADSFSAAEWQRLYALYASTYAMRGQSPYLNLDCLRGWARAFGERMPICVARLHGKLVAMALFFEDEAQLYGRHWGADADYHSLHFELCYYQGIERSLQRGLQVFDAGVQGEHKRRRGFDYELAWSLHWFREPALHEAVARAFTQEARMFQARLAPERGDEF